MLSSAARSCASSSSGCVRIASLSTQRHNLRLLRMPFRREHRPRLLFRVRKPRPRPHAERVVEHNQQQPAIRISRAPPHKRVGKRQHQQKNKSSAAQTAADTAAAGASPNSASALEKHQRAERPRRLSYAAAAGERNTGRPRRRARQEPWRKEAHLLSPLPDRQYSRSPHRGLTCP